MQRVRARLFGKLQIGKRFALHGREMARQSKKGREGTDFDLTEAHRELVFAVAMRYVKDHDAAADVAQDALLRAHRKRRSFRGDSKLSTWLYTIAATTALMHIRKANRLRREVPVPFDPDQLEGESDLSVTSSAPSPERLLDAREQIDVVREQLARLGDKYEHIFMLRYGAGHTEGEIAAKLGLTVPTVKSRAHRARQAVRAALLAEAELAQAA